ncbi:hypothetical protein F2P45_09365 [Massilia sp. CCM 8733]|uniref:Uncharacterized protein n=1 Tax=Massilia mucilaginosa TaxID=2609282 RepID=A0ABX0NR21_9BURK|nr:hypothetical protein [Massilia mucilaginosa]NHZ89224.1 hypothetical protein [Massilia mucilaginosa]
MTNPAIVAQHVTDVATTWWRRRRESADVRLRFDQLVDIDGVIDAHLDGLYEAGDAGMALAKAAYDKAAARRCFDVGADAFVLLSIAFLDDDREAMDDAIASLAGKPGFSDAVHGALAWFDSAAAASLIAEKISSGNGVLRHAALAHCHLHAAIADDALLAGTASPGAAEFDAIAHCGRAGLLPGVASFLGTATPEDPAFFSAARCALLLGERDGSIPSLQSCAASQGAHASEAVKLLCLALSGSQLQEHMARWKQCAEQRALTIQAAGWNGDPADIPWLIAQLDDSAEARLAGEAMRLITGLDLDANKMVRAEPRAGADSTPAYPLPDRARLTAWWTPMRSFTRAVCGICWAGLYPIRGLRIFYRPANRRIAGWRRFTAHLPTRARRPRSAGTHVTNLASSLARWRVSMPTALPWYKPAADPPLPRCPWSSFGRSISAHASPCSSKAPTSGPPS